MEDNKSDINKGLSKVNKAGCVVTVLKLQKFGFNKDIDKYLFTNIMVDGCKT